MERASRLLVAHDLPASVDEIFVHPEPIDGVEPGEGGWRLGPGWYFPRDEVLLVQEAVEKHGPLEIAYIDEEWHVNDVVAATLEAALMEIYNRE